MGGRRIFHDHLAIFPRRGLVSQCYNNLVSDTQAVA
jgi:hypothetical protein